LRHHHGLPALRHHHGLIDVDRAVGAHLEHGRLPEPYGLTGRRSGRRRKELILSVRGAVQSCGERGNDNDERDPPGRAKIDHT
jgi:hypothetical protein